MSDNTIVITPDSTHQMTFHVPYCIAAIADEVMAELSYAGVLDMLQTGISGEFSLRVSIPLADKPVDALMWVLAVLASRMPDSCSATELRISYADDVPRQFDHLVGRALRKLAKFQWKDGLSDAVQSSKAYIKEIAKDFKDLQDRIAQIDLKKKVIDERRDPQERELRNALAALRKAHRGAFDSQKLLKASTRWNVAQAMVAADSEELDELVQERDALVDALDSQVELHERAVAELTTLKARKCPKFYTAFRTKAGKVTLIVAG